MSQLWVINSRAEKARKMVLTVVMVNLVVLGCAIYGIYFCIGFGAMGSVLSLLVGLVWGFILYSQVVGLQKNVEHLFLTLGKGIFEDIRFDVEEGVDREVLEKSKKLGDFVERESFNTIIGKRYLASEELLYNLFGKKENLKKVLFDGVVIEIEAKDKNIDGVINIDKGGIKFFGNIEDEIRKKIILLMKILGVMECIIETIDDKVYICLVGGRLYYQFNVFKKIDINKNISRIKLFDEAVDMLVDEILL